MRTNTGAHRAQNMSYTTVMRSQMVDAALASIAIIWLVACAEPLTAPKAAPVRGFTAVALAANKGDISHLNRFSIAVQSGTVWRPDVPVAFTATVHANLPTERFQVSIQVPEVRLSERDGWTRSVRPKIRERLLPASEVNASLAADESRNYAVPLKIQAPGVYRVVVRARANDAPGFLDGQFVQNSAVVETWLLVTSQGARLIAQFDPALIPDGYIAQPGPFIAKRPRSNSPLFGVPAQPLLRASLNTPVLMAPPRSAALLAAPSGNGERQVIYYDSDSSAYEPVGGAQLYGSIVDQYSGSQTYQWYDVTNPDGIYTAVCGLAPTETETITVSTATGDVSVAGGGISETEYPETACLPGTDPSVRGVYQSSANPAKLFSNFQMIIPGSRALLGRSRGLVYVDLQTSSGTSFYDPGTDHIAMAPNDIFGAFGAFSAAHEYGHAVHQKALNGIPPSGTCPSPHYLDGTDNLWCAYTEGFADYHGVAVLPPQLTAPYYQDIEANSFYTPGRDGSIIEGAVAAFFLDLTDPANESFDTIQFPGSYVADLVATCQMVSPGSIRRVDGIDGFVYCLEQTVDPTVVNTYFTTRAPQPLNEANSATPPASWDRSAIRTLWLHDLYGR
jgi:hypothetical protein